MPKSIAFWIIFLILFVLAIFFSWPISFGNFGVIGVIFVLIAIIGWAVFGAPIKG